MSRVHVFGSINMDLVARVVRLPRPGETVAGSDFAQHPGGKGANQAVAAARCGADTQLIAKVGDDAAGAELRRFLSDAGVNVSGVTLTAEHPTGTALIQVDDDAENSIVVVAGANGALTPKDCNVDMATGDIVVSQFEIPDAAIHAAFERAHQAGATTILNPAPARAHQSDLLDWTDILILNETELTVLSGGAVAADAPADEIADAAALLSERLDTTVVATLGDRGLRCRGTDCSVDLAAHKVEAVDTTGAGDTFVGATAAQLANGQSLEDALRFANAAAALCVQRTGAAPSIPAADEVHKIL